MVIRTVTFNRVEGISRFEASLRTAMAPERNHSGRIDIHRAIDPPETLGDPFLAASLLPAMFLGEDLEVLAPVNARLVRSMSVVQDIYLAWYPDELQRVSVRTPQIIPDGTSPARPPKESTACFFSGGVDSWYSLLKHQGGIEALLTVKGFDLSQGDHLVWNELVAANRKIAAECGADLIRVETNLRECIDPTYPGLGRQYPGDFWGPVLHGAFLGAVGLCLQEHFGRVIIPGTYPYALLRRLGSHPLVDPLWSTGSTRFEHDGCEAFRIQKLRRIAESASALRHLRVCLANVPGRYNCGECEKCLRTMLALHVIGCFEQTQTFNRSLDLGSLETYPLARDKFHNYEEILAEAERLGQAGMVRLLRVLLGQKRSLRREWALLRQQSMRLGNTALRISGIHRHFRSIGKRWHRLRGMPP